MAARVELHQGNIRAFFSEVGPPARTLAKYGRRIVNDAKRSAPVDKGKYRASIQFLVEASPNALRLTVGSGLHYAEYIAKGTGIYGPRRRPIRPVHRKFLKFKPKGQKKFVFARQVRGMKPNNHLVDAMRAHIALPISLRP